MSWSEHANQAARELLFGTIFPDSGHLLCARNDGARGATDAIAPDAV